MSIWNRLLPAIPQQSPQPIQPHIPPPMYSQAEFRETPPHLTLQATMCPPSRLPERSPPPPPHSVPNDWGGINLNHTHPQLPT